MPRQGQRYEPRDEQAENEICRMAGSWLNRNIRPEENPVMFLGRGKQKLVVMNQNTWETIMGILIKQNPTSVAARKNIIPS